MNLSAITNTYSNLGVDAYDTNADIKSDITDIRVNKVIPKKPVRYAKS